MKVDSEALESILLELDAEERCARDNGDNTFADYLSEKIKEIRNCFKG